ncbi:hypothetical protein I3843_12G109000 [Carya illinoinensis]|uniref:Transmembrane protein n=1 Tax=Carya illinoinensis TaxID=32201 RepID=A0A922DJ79_CARIL|nr:uncharacterized protein LOC122290317 [Carya illinoinensis]KAG6685361.1 hypothetical protein I3842_12G108700 [Carya illinoinensis]KAG7953411.1 hypothetical protein I3843_12G109000 [Carya illinoinensis]
MEALWNLEDKLKLSTQEALVLLVCAGFAFVGICAATILKKKKGMKKQLPNHDGMVTSCDELMRAKCSESEARCGWFSIKRVLMGSVRWSRAKKWEEKRVGSGWRERPTPLLRMMEGSEFDVGWQSHNSESPVWQRPILMGEKCELPRFSGLILYDERGRQLSDQSHQEISCKENIHPQVKTAAVVRNTLRDLL